MIELKPNRRYEDRMGFLWETTGRLDTVGKGASVNHMVEVRPLGAPQRPHQWLSPAGHYFLCGSPVSAVDLVREVGK